MKSRTASRSTTSHGSIKADAVKTELIVATYNSPRALTLCLASVARQTVLPDSIAIADDGSGPETAAAIAAFAAAHPELRLRHVWHEDAGFRKAVILNKAIATSEADFLVFIDGDVMIHPGFIARHLALARPDRFSSGSLIRLDAEATAAVTEADVSEGRVFDMAWLRRNRAIDRPGTWLKAMPFPMPVQVVLDVLSPVQRAWGGSNASAFRDAILKVNGFDETMRWGGGDKELGIRLANSGVRGQHLRFTAPLVHLDHPRGYADPAHKRANRERLRARQSEGVTWIPDGISKGAPIG
jgi:GT2 family glycosyltransferase